MLGKPLCALFLAAALAGLWGCGFQKDASAAGVAVTQFHSELNKQDYTAIYAQADQRFRKASTPDDFEALMIAIHNKLGAVVDAKQQGFFVNYNTSGTQIRLTYQTKFTAGDAQEEFVWSKTGSSYQLLGYHINSNALITK
jgi:hypothetical protein